VLKSVTPTLLPQGRLKRNNCSRDQECSQRKRIRCRFSIDITLFPETVVHFYSLYASTREGHWSLCSYSSLLFSSFTSLLEAQNFDTKSHSPLLSKMSKHAPDVLAFECVVWASSRCTFQLDLYSLPSVSQSDCVGARSLQQRNYYLRGGTTARYNGDEMKRVTDTAGRPWPADTWL
jgi:hypothetical protein